MGPSQETSENSKACPSASHDTTLGVLACRIEWGSVQRAWCPLVANNAACAHALAPFRLQVGAARVHAHHQEEQAGRGGAGGGKVAADSSVPRCAAGAWQLAGAQAVEEELAVAK